MGIFSSIKNAIFGSDEAETTTPKNRPATARPTPRPTIAAGVAAAREETVDVEATLAAKDGADKLNWRTSIVDLLRLIDVDSSYEARKELATELGDTSYEGTAEDNIRLHKRVMKQLQKNGGKVPASMLD